MVLRAFVVGTERTAMLREHPPGGAPRNLRLLVVAVLLTGCLHKVAPQQLDQRTPVAVAFVSEEGTPVPDAFRARIFKVLDSRNLEAHEIDSGVVQAQKLSTERYRALMAAAPDAPFDLLVETRTVFFGQTLERFRWTVSLKLTAGRTGIPPVTDAVDLPATLERENEREADAMEDVSDFAAARLAPLIDGLLISPTAVAPVDGGTASIAPAADSIYFVMVDRFANGDRSNDADANVADPVAFHGGDFVGIEQHLDWLTQLGVGTVWLSPVFAMRTLPYNGYAAFHVATGSTTSTHVEPRFGTEGRAQGPERSAGLERHRPDARPRAQPCRPRDDAHEDAPRVVSRQGRHRRLE